HEPAAKHLEQLADFFSADRDAPQLPPREAEIFADCANGIVGLETSLGLALQLVHRSLIGGARLVEMMSLNPARLLRLERGSLATGAVADITVIDPNLEWAVEPDRFRSKSRNTPFMGMRLKGRAILTMVGGEIVYDGRRGDSGWLGAINQPRSWPSLMERSIAVLHSVRWVKPPARWCSTLP